jgi:hypothetical protein
MSVDYNGLPIQWDDLDEDNIDDLDRITVS